MIESWHVREALRYRFGSALVDVPGIWDRAAALLQRYAPYRDTFSDLAERLEDVIFLNAAVMVDQVRKGRVRSVYFEKEFGIQLKKKNSKN